MRKIIHNEISSIEVYEDTLKATEAAAEIICQIVKNNPEAAISYATGNTQIPVYEKMVEQVRRGEVSFLQTKAFQLDEYYPCAPQAPHSFVKFLFDHAFNPLKIKQDNIFIMNGQASDPEIEAERYNNLIAKYPVDIAILGIGPGGHIAFNERGTSFLSETHLAKLSEETLYRDHVERKQQSPDYCLTQGIATILTAKKIVLSAFGEKYQERIEATLMGPVTEECPASALRLAGGRVTIILDEQAVGLL